MYANESDVTVIIVAKELRILVTTCGTPIVCNGTKTKLKLIGNIATTLNIYSVFPELRCHAYGKETPLPIAIAGNTRDRRHAITLKATIIKITAKSKKRVINVIAINAAVKQT